MKGGRRSKSRANKKAWTEEHVHPDRALKGSSQPISSKYRQTRISLSKHKTAHSMNESYTIQKNIGTKGLQLFQVAYAKSFKRAGKQESSRNFNIDQETRHLREIIYRLQVVTIVIMIL